MIDHVSIGVRDVGAALVQRRKDSATEIGHRHAIVLRDLLGLLPVPGDQAHRQADAVRREMIFHPQRADPREANDRGKGADVGRRLPHGHDERIPAGKEAGSAPDRVLGMLGSVVRDQQWTVVIHRRKAINVLS
jgi:hypothetical protein